jgi:cell division protein FtsW
MNFKVGNIFKGDKVIWMVLLLLCIISIIEVFSASSSLTYKSQNYLGPISGHVSKIIMGVGASIVILNIPCRYFKLFTPFMLALSGIMLLWVLFFG